MVIILRGGSRIFLEGGALFSCSTSTPIKHIVFFFRIPVLLENRRSSWGGGGAHPRQPPPRSAPDSEQILTWFEAMPRQWRWNWKSLSLSTGLSVLLQKIFQNQSLVVFSQLSRSSNKKIHQHATMTWKMTYKINVRYLKRIYWFLLGKTVSKPKTCNGIHLYFDSNLAIYNAK